MFLGTGLLVSAEARLDLDSRHETMTFEKEKSNRVDRPSSLSLGQAGDVVKSWQRSGSQITIWGLSCNR
jgi:hypothetical protein